LKEIDTYPRKEAKLSALRVIILLLLMPYLAKKKARLLQTVDPLVH
jgi:hypothetical protein